jgi:DNA-binding PucR family transcriptional regulator
MSHGRTTTAVSEHPDIGGADGTRCLVAEAARRVRAQLTELASEMAAACQQQSIGLPADGQATLLRGSCIECAQNLLDVLYHRIPLDQVNVPTAAAAYARRVAQSDAQVESLLRAHRMGEEVFRRFWFRAAAEIEPVGVLPLEFVQHTEHVVAAYSDQTCQQLADIHGQERRRWKRRGTASRADQVRVVLTDITMTSARAEALTGYRMRGSHLGIVAWVENPEHADALHTATAGVLTDLTGRQPLVVPRDECTLWAWVSGPIPPPLDPDRLDAALRRHYPPIRLALGTPAPDLPGFRASHHDALSARRVAARAAGKNSRVTRYTEVALSSFLATDLTLARRWINTVLGGLAANDDGTAELRRTVLTYLQTGANLVDTAARLHLHKNTVRYRLAKAEELRGAPINDDRRNLEIALQASEQLRIPSDSASRKSCNRIE